MTKEERRGSEDPQRQPQKAHRGGFGSVPVTQINTADQTLRRGAQDDAPDDKIPEADAEQAR